MSFIPNLIISSYTMILLIIIFAHTKRSQDISLSNALYLAILIVTGLMLVSDTLGRLDGMAYSFLPVLNKVGNFFLFILQPVVPALWLLYAHLNIFRNRGRMKKLVLPVSLIFIANTILTVANQFNGIYYYIDANNIYHRGPYYLLATSFGIVLTVIAFFMVVLNRRIVKPNHFKALTFFPAIPIFSYALQIIFYGYQLAITGIALSLLFVLLRVQNQTIHTDYLTGIYNRKWLDDMTNRLVSHDNTGGNLSAIFIDLDDFKSINDKYGHDVGDQVLKDIAQVLQTCLGDLGYLARYGGDEFYILMHNKEVEFIEGVVKKIKGCMAHYNQTNPEGYTIRFSTGYVAYDVNVHKNVAGFQKAVDNLLYLNKREKQLRRLEEQGRLDG